MTSCEDMEVSVIRKFTLQCGLFALVTSTCAAGRPPVRTAHHRGAASENVEADSGSVRLGSSETSVIRYVVPTVWRVSSREMVLCARSS